MSSVQLGQYKPATHVIAHLSDTHFLGNGRQLYGTVDTDSPVSRALHQLERSGARVDALLFTGDIADTGETDAYRRIRDLVESAAERLGARVIWVMGNHDKRAAFRTELLREQQLSEPEERGRAETSPVDAVVDLDGLRVITLDTSVPGYHHGALSTAQLDWLSEVLSEPTRHGSLLALHHPPIPTMVPLMSLLELREQSGLAARIAGSDIRAILAGHLHYATTGTFAGIPVSVAAATCYTIDPSAPARELTGVRGGQSINLVHVYPGSVVHSHVVLGDFDPATRFDSDFLSRIEAMTPEERVEAFSRQA
jgi:3',5'-cyclic-AMP phosphodiesterase